MIAGAGQIVRLILRRDRARLAVWVLVVSALPAGVVAATEQGYPSEADRIAFAEHAAVNPAELATRGPVFAPTVGGLTAWTLVTSMTLIGGIVSALLVVRHTRTEEQAGRRELVGAGVLGRHAPLAAALGVVVGANLVIALLVTAALVASGLPPAGSLALGATIAGGGSFFAAAGAVAAQVAEASRTAVALVLAVLGAFFAAAAAGDVGGSWLVWLSPFGWARHVQSFAGDRWAVLLLFVVAIAALGAAAFALSARRDVGAGLVPARPGPATAGPRLRSPLALAWRLHRPAVLGWTAGAAALGLLLGAAMSSVGSQLDTPAFRELTSTLGGGDPADVFFRFTLYVLAQVVTASGLVTALQMRQQETSGLADALLAAPVARTRWAAGHVLIAAATVVAGLAVLGLGAGIGYGTPLDLVGTTLAYAPACLVFAGLAIALFGWAPRAAVPVTWTLLGLTLLIDLLGEFRLVDQAVMGLSPFVRTLGPLTAGEGLAGAVVVLAVVAGGLVAAGFAGLARRDVSEG
jgi:polyether ionophore transport system permease protein